MFMSNTRMGGKLVTLTVTIFGGQTSWFNKQLISLDQSLEFIQNCEKKVNALK